VAERNIVIPLVRLALPIPSYKANDNPSFIMDSPFITGWGLWHEDDSGDWHLDGGFSRVLHPKCEHDIVVPTTMHTTLHSLNPSLNRDLVYKFWSDGRSHKHALTTTAS
jgi:hypothetical protein